MKLDQIINRAISIARLDYGGPNDGMFTTANFQSAVRDLTGLPLGEHIARGLLANHVNVVRLSGGCHWQYAI